MIFCICKVNLLSHFPTSVTIDEERMIYLFIYVFLQLQTSACISALCKRLPFNFYVFSCLGRMNTCSEEFLSWVFLRQSHVKLSPGKNWFILSHLNINILHSDLWVGVQSRTSKGSGIGSLACKRRRNV